MSEEKGPAGEVFAELERAQREHGIAPTRETWKSLEGAWRKYFRSIDTVVDQSQPRDDGLPWVIYVHAEEEDGEQVFIVTSDYHPPIGKQWHVGTYRLIQVRDVKWS